MARSKKVTKRETSRSRSTRAAKKRRSDASRVVIKRKNQMNKTKLETFSLSWLDFIPPIFVKLFKYLYNLAFYQIEQAKTITYVELGALLIFGGTFALTFLMYKVLPQQVANFTSAVAQYIYSYDVRLTPKAYTNAFKGAVKYDRFMRGVDPVVLGVQTGSDIEHNVNNSEMDGTIRVAPSPASKGDVENAPTLINYNYERDSVGVGAQDSALPAAGTSIDAATYYSYF